MICSRIPKHKQAFVVHDAGGDLEERGVRGDVAGRELHAVVRRAGPRAADQRAPARGAGAPELPRAGARAGVEPERALRRGGPVQDAGGVGGAAPLADLPLCAVPPGGARAGAPRRRGLRELVRGLAVPVHGGRGQHREGAAPASAAQGARARDGGAVLGALGPRRELLLCRRGRVAPARRHARWPRHHVAVHAPF